ncbi:hypothetical protein SAMN04487972_102158 [Paracoccus halophilus]|uniref:Succinate dehydrogenase n=1 Tax=Paracoccus halophilus TaxID=376733 RepID=A0A099F7U8_9RHOB|nr:hypothetical protein [Paracoccus halophilus]KGJ06785.1 hypothetical protein IT41_01005 [Paracoccus halophilus]SFA41595.1 hypothetical protein SAMN04487972_102158 [Paracoccus halophilus]
MRLSLIMTVAALALSGCVVQNPGMAPMPMPTSPPAPAPDAAIRSSARVIINREMAAKVSGYNIAPFTDCVMANASPSELANITTSSDPQSAVAVIVSRPATGQCIANAAAAGRGQA